MHAPREQAQHAACGLGVGWLAEYRFIDHDNRVCPEHAVLRPGAPDCERLLRASRSAHAGGGSPVSTVSSTSAGCTLKKIPALRSSSCRRGEAEARTSMGF
jgi:hypothetical protein